MMSRLIFLLIPFLLFAYTEDRGLQLKKMHEEARTALVVGNSEYKSLNNLKNPVNDARAMRNVLQQRGFTVIYLENVGRKKFDRQIKKFTTRLKNGGVGLFYFAGHGIQVDGDNYLVATDSDLADKDDVRYDTIALNEVTRRMRNAHNRVNIVILDACRNDPFSRSGSGGLAPLKNARGMFVAYATEAGKIAKDGRGKNGIFTKHLIRHMNEPVKIEEVFKRTRLDVATETDEQQFPGVYNQLVGDFYFKLPSASTAKSKASSKPSSSYRFESVKPSAFSLTVETEPSDARVAITNIKPRYHDGIRLKPGSYTIKVTRAGYVTKRGSVDLKNNLSIKVTLERESAPTPAPAKASRSSVEPEMVLIRSGSFLMGSNDGDDDEKPVHRVNIGYDFYIGKYEVTIGEYAKCVSSGSCPSPEWLERGSKYNIYSGSEDYYQTMCLNDSCPAIGVSWHNTKAYAKWLSKKTGHSYRLPSEAEWEYAARASTSSTYSFGNSSNSLGSYAWYNGNSGGKTHPVGQKQPNQWGLYDMHGNVWEWCEDTYAGSYRNTPTDGSAYSRSGDRKVLRGGSWGYFPAFLRSANRDGVIPAIRSLNNGFRLARDR